MLLILKNSDYIEKVKLYSTYQILQIYAISLKSNKTKDQIIALYLLSCTVQIGEFTLSVNVRILCNFIVFNKKKNKKSKVN